MADTMALVLRLEKRRLGKHAKAIFDDMEAGNALIHLPSLVFAEVLYLAEKKRISIGLPEIASYLSIFAGCQEVPLTFAIVQKASLISDIPELHDRLIAATALQLGDSLLTNDPVIQASGHVTSVW